MLNPKTNWQTNKKTPQLKLLITNTRIECLIKLVFRWVSEWLYQWKKKYPVAKHIFASQTSWQRRYAWHFDRQFTVYYTDN